MADNPVAKPRPRARSKRAVRTKPDKIEPGKAESARPKLAKPLRRKRAGKSLGDDFLAAVREDFRDHGASVIASVRADKPDQYLKIVLSVLPKDLNVTINSLDTLSDDEIRRRIRGLEAVLRPFLDPLGDPGAPGGGGGVSGAAGGAGPPAPH